MRRTLATVVGATAIVGTMVVGCGTPEPSAQSVELPAPAKPTLATFEATFDVERQTATFTVHQPTGVSTQTVTIPWATSGDAGAYLHTRVATWQPTDGGAIPSGMSVGVSAENLYGTSITNFTAVIDGVSQATVGLCDVNTTGTNACAKGGMTSTWSCASGSASPASLGVPPCRLDYGTINHTGHAGAAGTTAGDPGTPLPWWFIDSTGVNFSIVGHVEGDAIPPN